MGIILRPILQITDYALGMAMFLVLASVILSLLISFGIIHPYRYPIIGSIHNGFERLLAPAYHRIRRVIPILGGLDLSPAILMLGLLFLQLIARELLQAIS